jgi:hypothetical protein
MKSNAFPFFMNGMTTNGSSSSMLAPRNSDRSSGTEVEGGKKQRRTHGGCEDAEASTKSLVSTT